MIKQHLAVLHQLPYSLQSVPGERRRPHREEPCCPEPLSAALSIPATQTVPPQMPGQPDLTIHGILPTREQKPTRGGLITTEQ